MKPHPHGILTKALPVYRRIFEPALLREMEQDCLGRCRYARKATPRQAALALLKAIILQLPDQESILEAQPSLGLTDRSSLSYLLERCWLREFFQELSSYLALKKPMYDPALCAHPRFLLDTMPELIQRTQRGNCPRYNNVAKGVGVMNAINLDAVAGQCIAQVLKIMPGSWNDTYQVRDVELISRGPIYICDRGFYSLETVAGWRRQEVHFVGRVKKQNLSYTVEQELPCPRRDVGGVRLESDEIVTLGRPGVVHRSRVRLSRCWLREEDLWLISDQFDCPVEKLLEMYLDRGKIEVYHRLQKMSAGLSHLYSFDENGMSTQIYATVLLLNLMYLSAPEMPDARHTVQRLAKLLESVRQQLGVRPPLRRNTVAQRRPKPPHNRRWLKTKSAAV